MRYDDAPAEYNADTYARTYENEVFDTDGNAIGYHTHFTGAYVCYTCGHLCDCGEDEE